MGDPGDESQIDVTRIARVLAASWKPIAAVVIAVAVIVFLLSHSSASKYRATARIVADSTATTTTGTSADTDARMLATSVALLTTPDVLDAAARRVPGETGASLRDRISTSVASDADVITVTATDDGADAAAADANAVARAFLERRTANERAAILRTRAALNAQLAAVGRGTAAAGEAAAIRTRLSELVVDEANAGNDLSLAEAAEPPSGAYAPRPARNAVLAAFVTFILAALAVILRDQLRPRSRDERDVERASGVPVLAALPSGAPSAAPQGRLDGLARRLEDVAQGAPPALRKPLLGATARRREAQAARGTQTQTATADGLRSLLGAVLLAAPPGERRVILVTSAARDQGSARVAAGLARALAQAGQDTLAVSTDAASSSLARTLGVAPAPGLTEALDQARAGTAVRLRAAAVPGIDTLHVVPAGGPSHDGVGLVRPGAVDALFVALGNTSYEYVVVEAPALLSAPEAWLVARNADVAIIACPEKPEAEELADARRALERLDVRVLGAVCAAPESDGEPDRRERRRPEPERELQPPASILASLPPVRDDDEPEEAAGGEDAASANGAGAPAAEARLLLERLRMADHPLTFSQLRDALGDPPPSRVRARLRQLVEGGDVVRRGSGRRGDPYVYGLSDR
jgi:capsular polysaccharide biosynthesis protein/Mrp family chromosome partitioning ATPase